MRRISKMFRLIIYGCLSEVGFQVRTKSSRHGFEELDTRGHSCKDAEVRFQPAGPYTDSRMKDPFQASIGRDAVDPVGDLLASLGLWPFTSHLGWSVAQYDCLIQQVRGELQDVELKLYLPM
jgi:hypothetical protein